jgi:hypothetical protein
MEKYIVEVYEDALNTALGGTAAMRRVTLEADVERE